MAHVEQREHQFLRFRVGQPGHVFIDGPLDGVAGIAQVIAQPLAFGEAKSTLFPYQVF